MRLLNSQPRLKIRCGGVAECLACPLGFLSDCFFFFCSFALATLQRSARRFRMALPRRLARLSLKCGHAPQHPFSTGQERVGQWLNLVQGSARLVHIFNWQSCQNHQECGSICSCTSTSSVSTGRHHKSEHTSCWVFPRVRRGALRGCNGGTVPAKQTSNSFSHKLASGAASQRQNRAPQGLGLGHASQFEGLPIGSYCADWEACSPVPSTFTCTVTSCSQLALATECIQRERHHRNNLQDPRTVASSFFGGGLFAHLCHPWAATMGT